MKKFTLFQLGEEQETVLQVHWEKLVVFYLFLLIHWNNYAAETKLTKATHRDSSCQCTLEAYNGLHDRLHDGFHDWPDSYPSQEHQLAWPANTYGQLYIAYLYHAYPSTLIENPSCVHKNFR